MYFDKKEVPINSRIHVLFRLILLLCVPGFTDTPGLSFAVVGDAHIKTSSETNTLALRKAVEKINSQKVSFTVFAGDFVDSLSLPNMSLFKEIVGALDSGYYLLPGNHEIGMIPTGSTLKQYRKHVDSDYCSIRLGNTKIVCINSQLLIADIYIESQNHLSWLESELKLQKHSNIIILSHMPLFTNTITEPYTPNNNVPLKNRATVLRLLHKYKVKAFLSAHLHRHNKQIWNSILFESCEATTGTDNSGGFRVYTMKSSGTIWSQFIPLND